jgi:hypothetical protein
VRRSVLGVLVALMLVPVVGGGVALAAPPVPPRITDVAVTWGMRTWDDGTVWCTLMTTATFDPGFTKGSPVYAHAYAHLRWVGFGDGSWQDWNFSIDRLQRGDTSLHTYTGFGGDHALVVDRVRFELWSKPGDLLDSMEVPTANTCMNG